MGEVALQRAGETVLQARDRYLQANGFSIAGYTEPTFTLQILGRAFRFRNTKARQAAVPLHDLHHVATGYATTWTGEAEIGAWELRAGCNSFITYFLNGGVALVGLFHAPRRTWRAFRRGRGHTTLYLQPDLPYETLLAMSVPELRALLGIPADGLAG